jgi:beta-glucosidase
MQQSPAKKQYAYSDAPDLKAHAEIARAVAAQGMVLLKNDAQTLPLKDAKNLALFGNASYELVVGGTGSGDVNEAYSITLEQGLVDAGLQPDESLKQRYQAYIKEAKANQPRPRGFFRLPPPIPQMPPPVDDISRAASDADMAVITIGRNSGEFSDRQLEDDFYLSAAEQELIQAVSRVFHANNKKVVVVLNVGGVIEVASWRNQVDAILLAWQPGQEGGHPIADVLTGKVNPSGRLASTFPMTYEDVPSAKNFPGTPADKPESVTYEEGVYVGYRYYNTFDVKTAYEFGYGLSYTDFKYGKIKLSSKKFKNDITAKIKIKNIGKVPGKEVVQLYISAPANDMHKPAQELRAFAKTKLLHAGESETISFTLTACDLASFDTPRTAWVAEPGTYEILIGASSLNIQKTTPFQVPQEIVVEKLTKALTPQVEINEMTPAN